MFYIVTFYSLTNLPYSIFLILSYINSYRTIPMKRIIVTSLLSLFACTSFAAPKETNIYKDFMDSSKKEEFLKNYINNYVYIKEIIGKKKCDEVSTFGKIAENNMVMHMQVSCKNIKDDFHILMTKVPNTMPLVDSCKEAAKRFNPEVQCGSKLK